MLAGTRFRPLDQPHLQLQKLSQSCLFVSHLAIIILVIESGQMKNTVQYKNSCLFCDGVSQANGVFSCDVSGNRELASNLFYLTPSHLRRWKRQYIRGFVFSAELPVERT